MLVARMTMATCIITAIEIKTKVALDEEGN